MHTRAARLPILLALLLAPLALLAEPGLYDLKGQDRDLAEYTGKGQWLVAMIWASDCHVCNQEAHQYVDFYEQNKEKNATLLGISMDGPSGKAAAEAFIERNGVTFPNLLGEPETVAGLYTALTGGEWIGTPTFLIFAPDGRLMAAQAGAAPAGLIADYIERKSAELAAAETR